MNKTVNINLAGIFFHVDEDAYLKLQRYLEAIKRSFTDSQGRNEIVSDIEARIAELFSERIKSEKQVIGMKEVDEVIAIMGQPEDYLVDDEIFEDEPKAGSKSSTSRKLFRDTDNSYIGGVSAGLAHYFGIDAIWIRLIWILLVVGGGTGILLYILLWILVPEAKTTAEKIMMTGEPVNISNIEKKIKDGFDNVSDAVSGAAKNVKDAAKNVDIKGKSSKIKSSSQTFFDAIGDVILFFFKIFAKFIGVLLIIIGASTLIGLIIGTFSVGIVDIVHIPGMDLVRMANAGNTPIWLASILVLFAVGIPFFFLFYLGLKILVNNLKSIGNIAKFTLLGVWFISVISLIIIGVREASEHALNEGYVERTQLPVKAHDTLEIKMVNYDNFKSEFYRNHNGFKIIHDTDGNKVLYSTDIDIIVKSTKDSLASIAVEKSADGRNYETAIERAKNIDYKFELQGNTLLLNNYLTTNPENKFSDQEVDLVLYLPEQLVAKFNDNTSSYLYYKRYEGNLVSRSDTNHYLTILEDAIQCDDCPADDDSEIRIKIKTPHIDIDEDGVEINAEGGSLKINKSGVKAEGEKTRVQIDSNGVDISTDNN
ncbi:PspC domain-containing protein [Gaetbulibacter aestuarii]|uniref:PspC domain-containing protein n=1 Tax=Gaetbulibacter aestuarii TaxID=1502358 RepID=A0ABW7MXG4_9FLAO